jgi:hypothetical protein
MAARTNAESNETRCADVELELNWELYAIKLDNRALFKMQYNNGERRKLQSLHFIQFKLSFHYTPRSLHTTKERKIFFLEDEIILL